MQNQVRHSPSISHFLDPIPAICETSEALVCECGSPRCTMDLRSAIKHAIEPWKDRADQPPPFTLNELVVMALVLHDKPMDREELFVWIHFTFHFYQTPESAQSSYSMSTGQDTWSRRMPQSVSPSLLPSFYDTVLDYNVPLHAQDDELKDGTKWTVDDTEARLYLQPCLWPFERKGHFPFLSLPPEIRNCIYEMVFRFPPCGLQIDRDRPYYREPRRGMVYIKTRDWERPLSSNLERGRYSWNGPNRLSWKQDGWREGKEIEVGKLSQVLSLTRVSRQVRDESRGIFYAVNTFQFTSVWSLCSMLEQMPAREREHMARTAFDYRCRAASYCTMKNAFDIMSTMKSLSWLHISIFGGERSRQYWRGDPDVVSRLQFDKAAAIGKHVEVVLEGEYPEIIEKQIRMEACEDESPSEEVKEEDKEESLNESPRFSSRRSTNNRTFSGFLRITNHVKAVGLWMKRAHRRR